MSRFSVLLVGVIVLSPMAVWGAAPACNANLDPLVEAQFDRAFVPRSIRLPPSPYRIVEQMTVTSGGAATVLWSQSPPSSKVFAAGFAKAADLAALRQALSANRVSQQADCVIENDLSGPIGVRILGYVEITWHGRSGRRNRFTVSHEDPGRSVRPRCSAEVRQLLQAVATFDAAVSAEGGNVLCSQ